MQTVRWPRNGITAWTYDFDYGFEVTFAWRSMGIGHGSGAIGLGTRGKRHGTGPLLPILLRFAAALANCTLPTGYRSDNAACNAGGAGCTLAELNQGTTTCADGWMGAPQAPKCPANGAFAIGGCTGSGQLCSTSALVHCPTHHFVSPNSFLAMNTAQAFGPSSNPQMRRGDVFRARPLFIWLLMVSLKYPRDCKLVCAIHAMWSGNRIM